MIYIWLEHIQIMVHYDTYEQYQTALDNINSAAHTYFTRNELGSKTFVERNTKQWND